MYRSTVVMCRSEFKLMKQGCVRSHFSPFGARYQRGRLKLDKLSAAVGEINSILSKKYKVRGWCGALRSPIECAD